MLLFIAMGLAGLSGLSGLSGIVSHKTPVIGAILLESGDYLLLEDNSSHLVLE